MRQNTYTQVMAIVGENPMDAAEKFNQAMRDLKDFSNLSYEREGNTFLIYYTISEQLPESIAEAYEMDGTNSVCAECKHCRRDVTRFGIVDQRKKWGRCVYHDKPVLISSPACDEFYTKHFEMEGEDENEPEK